MTATKHKAASAAAQTCAPTAHLTPAMAAALDAVSSARAEQDRLHVVLTAAEEAWFFTASDADKAAAKVAENEAEKAYHQAVDQHTEALETALRVPTVAPADIAAKNGVLASLNPAYDDTTHFLQAMLAGTLAAIGAQPPPQASDAAFNAAYEAYRAARATHTEAHARFNAAWEQLNAEAPWPKELQQGDGDVWNFEVEITKSADLTFEKKVEMLEILRAFQPIRDAAHERLRLDQLAEAEEALWPPVHEAREAVMQVVPTTMPNVALKLRMMVEEYLDREDSDDERRLDLDDPLDMSELLSRSDYTIERNLTLLYQQTAHLAGMRSPALSAAPFDPEAWVAAFETLPGHQVTPRGVEYQEPAAWGVPSRDELMLTDPEALARYDEYVRQRFTDEQWAEYGARGSRPRPGQPFFIECISQLEDAYPHGGPEFDRLKAVYDRRLELWSKPPIGAPKWQALLPWQKKAVRAFASKRDWEQKHGAGA
jgi:hypothetical protein